MDITNVFKACVKTVKTRNRALGTGQSENDRNGLKQSLLGQSKTRSDFYYKTRDIVTNISKLRDYILKHRKAYIDADHLSSDTSGMLDAERDQIDADLQAVMRTCSQLLRDFKLNVLQQTSLQQEKEYKEAVIKLIEKYLRSVCEMYSEQRAIRIQRAVQKQKLFRLEPDAKRSKLSDERVPATTPFTESSDELGVAGSSKDIWMGDEDADDGEGLSSEEIQMFEQENQSLYNELSTFSDDIRQIEGQVMEIAKLQDVFTTKILEQDHDMNRISDTVVHTTENIRMANEDIREAMKANASFRAWILFFLIVLAFSLLFLDWYNP